jgi:MFS family permease
MKTSNGKYVARLSIICGILLAGDSIEVLLLSLLGPLLQSSSWEVSLEMISMLQATIFIGELLGAMTLGPLSDIYGRRPVTNAANSMIFVAGLGTAFATNFWSLVALRVIVGVGIGGLSVR